MGSPRQLRHYRTSQIRLDIKLEHVPKPPPKGTKRRIGDTGQKMPAGGRLLKNPSDATLVGMKFERPKQIQGKDGIEPNDKYPPLMDAFTRTQLAVIEDIIYLRKVADRIGALHTRSKIRCV